MIDPTPFNRSMYEKGYRLDKDGVWSKPPRAVGGLEDTKRQPRQRREGEDSGVDGVQGGVGFRVTIISVRSRLVDAHDNIRTGAKPIVDRITTLLGFDNDNDSRLQWDYAQIIGKPEGTIVKIDRL